MIGGLVILLAVAAAPTVEELSAAAAEAYATLAECSDAHDGCAEFLLPEDIARAFLIRATEAWVLRGEIDGPALASARLADEELVESWWAALPDGDAEPEPWVVEHWGPEPPGEPFARVVEVEPKGPPPRVPLRLGGGLGAVELGGGGLFNIALDASIDVGIGGPAWVLGELRVLLSPETVGTPLVGGRALVGLRLGTPIPDGRLEFDFLLGGTRSSPSIEPQLFDEEAPVLPRFALVFAGRGLAKLGRVRLGGEGRVQAQPTVARYLITGLGEPVEEERLVSQGQQASVAVLLEIPLPKGAELEVAGRGGFAASWDHDRVVPVFGITVGASWGQ